MNSKSLGRWGLGLCVLAFCGTAFSQDPEEPEVPDVYADLAAQVAGLSEEVAMLQDELLENRRVLDQTVQYLQSQSSAASEMMGVFTAAENAGFTAGINYQSREILLAGFRKYMESRGKGIPGAEAKKPEGEMPALTPPVR